VSSLREQAARGVKWTSLSTALVVVIGIAQMAVLTRLLSRADFGLMAMVTTVTGFAHIYADMGLSNAIIQRKSPTRDQLSTLYWTNILTGAVLFLAVVAVSPLVTRFYREPGLQELIVGGGLIFLIMPLGQQFQILLQKELEFDRLARIDVSSAATGFAVAVAAAAAGLGVWALVIGILAQSAARVVQLVAVGWRRWRPHLHFARADLEGYLGFGLYQIGERTIYYFAANIDYLLIGRYLGAEQLGIYTIAYQLVVIPVTRVNPVLTKVAFPVFARRQDDPAALRRGFGELIELVALVTFPLLVGLGVVAPVAVPAIFGPNWEPSVVLVQILVVMGLFMCLSNPLGSALLAKGRADIGFWLNVANTAVVVPVLWVAVRWGTAAVAWGHTVIALLLFLVELWIVYRILAMGWKSYLARLVRPAATTAAMAVAVAVAYLLVARTDLRPIVQLIPLVVLGGVVYVAVWWLIARAYLRDLWRLLVGRGPNAPRPEPEP